MYISVTYKETVMSSADSSSGFLKLPWQYSLAAVIYAERLPEL